MRSIAKDQVDISSNKYQEVSKLSNNTEVSGGKQPNMQYLYLRLIEVRWRKR